MILRRLPSDLRAISVMYGQLTYCWKCCTSLLQTGSAFQGWLLPEEGGVAFEAGMA
jgi:hypothetical protein